MPEPIVIEVIVDAWQNQRYKPLQGGWTLPFPIEAFPFSDISGDVQIPCGDDQGKVLNSNTRSSINMNKLVPYAELPEGWEWACDWKLDASQTYGQKDSSGWSYSSSFDSICKASMCRALDGNMGRLSVVRRRRWTRRRVCVSESAVAVFKSQKHYYDRTCAKIGEIIMTLDVDWKYFAKYECLRAMSMSELFKESDAVLNQNVGALQSMVEKLQLFKNYLKERAYVELQYSKQLEKLSGKWINAGLHNPRGRRSRVEADLKGDEQTVGIPSEPSDGLENVNDDRSSIISMSNEAISAPKSKGFFHTVCTASNSVAKRLEDFSVLLTKKLCQDVDEIIASVNTVLLASLKGDVPNMRRVLAKTLSALEYKASVCDKILSQSRAFLFAQRHAISHTLYNVSAAKVYSDDDEFHSVQYKILVDIRKSSWLYMMREVMESDAMKSKSLAAQLAPLKDNILKKMSLSTSLKGRTLYPDIMGSAETSNIPATTINNGNDNKSDNNGSNSNQASIIDTSVLVATLPNGGFDTWLALQSYRGGVIDAETKLYVFQGAVKQMHQHTQDIMEKVSTMLQETVKVFAHEQCRAWDEARTILETICLSVESDLAAMKSESLINPSDNDTEKADGAVAQDDDDDLWKDFEKEKSVLDASSKDIKAEKRKSFTGTTIDLKALEIEFENLPSDEEDTESGQEGGESANSEGVVENKDEEVTTWKSSALNKLQVPKYISKISHVKFALFPKSTFIRRNHPNYQSTTLKLTAAQGVGSTFSMETPTASSSGKANQSVTEYAIPRPGYDTSAPNALSNHIADPFVWHDGIMVMTYDAVVHFFCEIDVNMKHPVTTIADFAESVQWTNQRPVISIEASKLLSEPSMMLFPGITGDIFILRCFSDNKDINTTTNGGASAAPSVSSESASESATNSPQVHSRYMNGFVRDQLPLSVVVKDSEEVKTWVKLIGNPYGKYHWNIVSNLSSSSDSREGDMSGESTNRSNGGGDLDEGIVAL